MRTMAKLIVPFRIRLIQRPAAVAIYTVLAVAAVGVLSPLRGEDRLSNPSAADRSTPPAKKTADNPVHTPTAAEIDRLVGDLGSSDYRVREQATRQLIAAGPVAIDALSKALKANDFEISVRALRVMQAFLEGQNRAAQAQAAEVLESLASNVDSALAGQASDAIDLYHLTQQVRALAALRRLGATVRFDGLEFGNTGNLIVEMNSDWGGQIADLEYLKQVPDLWQLTIINVRLDEAALKTLGQLTQLSGLKLYGTGVSAEAGAVLGQQLPGVAIERRGGGLLGIRGMKGETPCRVTDVPEGTAASAADIRGDDIVLSLDGRPIQSFDELYTLIGEKKGGDHVKLEIRRDDQVMVKDVTLGQWQ
jgi:PDZ domain